MKNPFVEKRTSRSWLGTTVLIGLLPTVVVAQQTVADPEPERELGKVKVTAEPVREPGVKVDEAGLTRSGASVLDTPQLISVIPVEVTEQQAAQSIGDVVRNTARRASANYFGTYESVYARGFWMQTTSNYLRNGFRWIHLSQPAKRNVERYEIIKGPAGLDYGRVEPGALMNIVSKRPSAEASRELTLSASGGEGWDAGFDVTGPLNESGTVLFRLNGGIGRQAFVSDEVDPRQEDVAAALSFQIAERTRLDLDFEYTDREQLIYPGLPVPLPRDARSADALPLDAFYGEAAGRFDGGHELFTARIEHGIADGWRLDAAYSRNNTYRDVRQIRITGVTGNAVGRAANPFDQEFDVETLQAELKGHLRLGRTRHRLTVTADRPQYDREGSGNNVGSVAATTLVGPVRTGATFVYGPSTVSSVEDTGVALQDYVELLPRLNALAGIRFSRYDERNPGVPAQTGRSSDPTLALIFKPNPSVSAYLSYASAFLPNSGTLLAPGVYADPSEGEQGELGLKFDALGGALRVSASVHELTKTNVPTPSPVNAQFSVLSGEVRSRGFELEAVGEIRDGWSVLGSYGYTDSRIARDNVAANVGRRPAQTPVHTASLWSTVALGGRGRGWTIGGGVFHTGGKFVANNNLVEIPSYVLADLMASYRFERGLPGASVQLNLRNVFDERHYEGGGSGALGFTNLYPGLPRTLAVSVRVPF